MRKSLIVLAAIAITAMVVYTSCSDSHAGEKSKAVSEDDHLALVKRGEYLVSTIGCDDCHSPKKMGPTGPEIIPELLL